MWLFTTDGFYSVACARQGDGSKAQPVDPDRMMIRARRREHLVRLIERFDELMGDAAIIETPDADYRYRCFVAKSVWTEVASQLAAEIDYDNFKSAVARHLGSSVDASRYVELLHEVWDVMYRLQPKE